MQNIEPDLDIYELAYLAGDLHTDRILEVVIVNLIEQGYLLWDKENKVLIKLDTEDNISRVSYQILTAKERCVLNGMPQNCTIDNLRLGWGSRWKLHFKTENIKNRLEYLNLIYIDWQNSSRVFPLLEIAMIMWSFSLIAMILILISRFIQSVFQFLIAETPILVTEIINANNIGYEYLIWSSIGLLTSVLLNWALSETKKTNENNASLNKKRLLEKYREQIPAVATNLNDSLSKAYALYGSVVLTDSKFEGLAEFFKRPLIFDRQSTYHTGRKQPDADSCDFDIDYDNTSFDNSCSSDSGCSAGCSSD